MAEPGAVKERPVQKVVEEKGRHEARAEPIFGSLAVAVPVAEPALAVELKLTTEEARHLVRNFLQPLCADGEPVRTVLDAANAELRMTMKQTVRNHR